VHADPHAPAAVPYQHAALGEAGRTSAAPATSSGAITDGYSFSSNTALSPGRQSMLLISIDTPSATDETKPISPAATPLIAAARARARSTSASCARRPASPLLLSMA